MNLIWGLCAEKLHVCWKISINKPVKFKHEHALKQWQGFQLSLWFCPTHICMCFRFQWCINKQLPLSESRVPGCIWGLSVVITDHLIIITTIKNESVQACDIWMANITGWVDHISEDETWLDSVWHFISFKLPHRDPHTVSSLLLFFVGQSAAQHTVCVCQSVCLCVRQEQLQIWYPWTYSFKPLNRKVCKSVTKAYYKGVQ